MLRECEWLRTALRTASSSVAASIARSDQLFSSIVLHTVRVRWRWFFCVFLHSLNVRLTLSHSTHVLSVQKVFCDTAVSEVAAATLMCSNDEVDVVRRGRILPVYAYNTTAISFVRCSTQSS
jgi:hypothetical protein